MSADHHTDMAISPHYYSFTQKNILIMSDFIVELLVRVFSKTPWFFKVVQIISAVALVVSGLPQLLAQSGVNIPEAWTGTVAQIVSIASMVAIFLAQLTTTTKVKEVEKLRD